VPVRVLRVPALAGETAPGLRLCAQIGDTCACVASLGGEFLDSDFDRGCVRACFVSVLGF